MCIERKNQVLHNQLERHKHIYIQIIYILQSMCRSGFERVKLNIEIRD